MFFFKCRFTIFLIGVLLTNHKNNCIIPEINNYIHVEKMATTYYVHCRPQTNASENTAALPDKEMDEHKKTSSTKTNSTIEPSLKKISCLPKTKHDNPEHPTDDECHEEEENDTEKEREEEKDDIQEDNDIDRECEEENEEKDEEDEEDDKKTLDDAKALLLSLCTTDEERDLVNHLNATQATHLLKKLHI